MGRNTTGKVSNCIELKTAISVPELMENTREINKLLLSGLAEACHNTVLAVVDEAMREIWAYGQAVLILKTAPYRWKSRRASDYGAKGEAVFNLLRTLGNTGSGVFRLLQHWD